MPRVPADAFAFCGPTYLLPSPVIDCQRSINLYPEPGIASSKGRMGLTGRPGLFAFGSGLPTSPVLRGGLWAGNRRLFAAAGTHCYEVSTVGGVTQDYGSFGGGSTGPIYFEQNGGSASFQLAMLDISQNVIFNVNPAGPSMDPVFNATAMTYADGFQVAVAAGASLNNAGQPNQINVSNFGDITTWDPLNFIIRTGASDLVKGLSWLNGLLYIFGESTLEIYFNEGNPGFPFARVNGGQVNLGLVAAHSIVKFYNCVMFLGGDRTGYPQVYMMQGMNPVRVSNAAIEFMIESLSGSFSIPSAWAYGYQEGGHTFYCLSFLNLSLTGLVHLCYDLTTGLWHERSYAGAIPITGVASIPQFGTLNGGIFVGDIASNQLYTQQIVTPSDGGTAITYTRQAPHVTNDNMWHKYTRFELDCDIGGAAATLTYSNDGGKTYGSQNYALKQANNDSQPAGAASIQPRYFAMQLGRSRDRAFKVQITSSTQLVRINNALLDID